MQNWHTVFNSFFPGILIFSFSQILSSVQCVLVTPKRKLAGQLTITQKALHFSFEFLVEGTGGTSVFNRYQEKDSDPKNDLGGAEKLKGSLDGGRGNATESGDALMKNTSNKIKHHRRWKISRVRPLIIYSHMHQHNHPQAHDMCHSKFNSRLSLFAR